MLLQHKYEFAIKAVRQLEKANIVRESDSPWRSNVVMVPKPVGKMSLEPIQKLIINQEISIKHSIIGCVLILGT
jgi:hypothetical protein